ncbi:unnamed protein product [Gadus morhua 'NCC']
MTDSKQEGKNENGTHHSEAEGAAVDETMIIVEKADSQEHVEGNIVRMFRAISCKTGTAAAGTIFIQEQMVSLDTVTLAVVG